MSGLPKGWAVGSLAELCERIVDGSHNPPKTSEHGKPMLSARNIQERRIQFDEFRLISDADFELENKRTSVQANDVLLTIVGTIGRTAVVSADSGTFALQRSVAVLRAPSLVARYLSYTLEAPAIQKLLNDNAKGTAQKGVYLTALGNFQLPLAPLPEQKRIADKLDSVLARVDACRERLDGIPTLLKRFRQSVLAAATSGRLTEDWRISTGAAPDAMYPRIKLSSVATSRLGKMLDKAKNTGTPTPYLRNVNVRWYSFDLTDVQMMRIEKTERDDLLVMNGDVLICEGGEPGRCAIWKGEDGQVIFQKALHRVRPDPTRLLSDWLVHSLKYSAESRSLDDLFTGTTIKHLTGASLANFVVPLPPLPEQHEIVRRVETLFAFADRLEARCTAARKQVGQLTPALLAKAFRGELVPQDPNDEPAAELLKRLAASRGDAPRARRGRRSPAPDAA